jgi:hypothetical protein
MPLDRSSLKAGGPESSLLDYDMQTLNSRDYSYERQLADAEREGWEIDPTMHSGDTVYLRRHQRVA